MSYLGLPSVSELVRALSDNPALRAVCHFLEWEPLPSADTFRRIRRKLAAMPELIESLNAETIERLREYMPDLGKEVAVDPTTVRSHSNGNRKPASDPDAAWGLGNKSGAKKGKSWVFGYKGHLVADANYDVPLFLRVTPANVNEIGFFTEFMEDYLARHPKPEVAVADRGYDSKVNSEWLHERGIAPVIHKKGAPQSGKHAEGWHPPGFSADGVPYCDCEIEPREYLRTDWNGNHIYGKPAGGCSLALPSGQSILPGLPPCKEEVVIDPERDIRLFGGRIWRGSPEWEAAYRKRWSVERVFSLWKGPGNVEGHHLRGMANIELLLQLQTLIALTKKLAPLKAAAGENPSAAPKSA